MCAADVRRKKKKEKDRGKKKERCQEQHKKINEYEEKKPRQVRA